MFDKQLVQIELPIQVIVGRRGESGLDARFIKGEPWPWADFS